MNLVNELQVSAQQDDVLTVLRNAKRVAWKLAITDINNWIRCEQEGYGDNDPIPKYREVSASVVMNTNGIVPVGYGMGARGTLDYPGNLTTKEPLQCSMNEIVNMIADINAKGRSIAYVLDEQHATALLRSHLHPLIGQQVTFALRLNSGQVRAIPEAVKDKILDWALELERRGILGENMTFSDREKQAAQATFNIIGCQIDQLTNSGKNIRRVGNG